MLPLASALSLRAFEVVYFCSESLGADRQELGWQVGEDVAFEIKVESDLHEIDTFIQQSCGSDCCHLVGGLLGSSFIFKVLKCLRKHRRKFWVLSESPAPSHLFWVKRLVYGVFVRRLGESLRGVLAIGNHGVRFFADLPFFDKRIIPFIYFVDGLPGPIVGGVTQKIFRFVFVGQFVERKNPSFILFAAEQLMQETSIPFEIAFVGSGKLAVYIESVAKERGLDCCVFLGCKPIKEARQIIGSSDCLILPSFFDGWGAVINEALLQGVPVICSKSCGSSDLVQKVPYSAVFETTDLSDLAGKMKIALLRGAMKKESRIAVAKKSKCLSSEFGASYLLYVLGITTRFSTLDIAAFREFEEHIAFES